MSVSREVSPESIEDVADPATERKDPIEGEILLMTDLNKL